MVTMVTRVVIMVTHVLKANNCIVIWASLYKKYLINDYGVRMTEHQLHVHCLNYIQIYFIIVLI